MMRHVWMWVTILLWAPLLARAQEAKQPERKEEAAQEETPPKQEEPKKAQEQPKKEIIITATRTEAEVQDVPQSVTLLTPEEIKRRQARTPNQMLREEPGIWSVQGNASGSPIIRGQIGNRVLYMWDGIRINNGALFGGPNSFFNNYPVGTVGQMEVIRGPGAVQYGSDAMGGVINIMSKRPAPFSEDFRYGGDVYARYGSVDSEKTEVTDLWISHKDLSVLVGATGQDVNDYKMPDGGRLDNTGYEALGGHVKVVLRPLEGHTLALSWIKNQRTDVETYTSSRLNPSGIPRNFTPSEEREIGKLDYTITEAAPWLTEVKGYGYYHAFDSTRDLTTETATLLRRTERDIDQGMYGGGLQGSVPLGFLDKSKLTLGGDYRIDNLRSRRTLFTRNKATGATTASGQARDVPDGTYDVWDTFAIAEVRPIDSLIVSAGVRYEISHLDSDPEPTDAIPPFTVADLTLDERWKSLTWSAGAVLWVTEEFGWAANVASGFRAPTYNDTLSTSVPVFATGIASVPSPGVDPERSITYELGPRYESSWLGASVTAYYTKLDDLIVPVNAGTIFIPGVGTVTARRGENIGEGYIWGVEAQASLRIASEWKLFGNYTVTRGKDTENDVPLRFIPPHFGVVGLRWETEPHQWWAEGAVVMANRVFRHAPDDELDAGFAQDPGLGSPNTTTNPPLREGFEIPGYAIINLRGGVEVWKTDKSSMALTLDVNNLLDKRYREVYSRQLAEPGRDIIVGMQITF